VKGILASILLIIILGASSCIPFKRSEYRKTDDSIAAQAIFPTDSSYLYRTSIKLYDQYFSGLMYLKTLDENHYRTIFLNEMGIKFFDFEFQKSADTSFTVHYIMEPLNKKSLIKVIRKDMEMLFYKEDASKSKTFRSDSNLVFINNKGLSKTYNFTDNNGKSQRLIEKGWIKTKKEVSLVYKKEIPAKKILIQHKNIKLSLEFKFLKYINSR
jgi:hypothetical protein